MTTDSFTFYSLVLVFPCLPFAAPNPEFGAAAAAERSTGGKERVKVGGVGPLPLVDAAAAAPLVVLAVKRLTLRPREGRRRLQQNIPY